MKVLIAGAGVGGLATARGLLTSGHSVQLLEEATSLREGGAAVTIFSNGFAALAGLGIDATGLGGLIERMHFQTAGGSRLSRVDLRAFSTRTGFPRADYSAQSTHRSSERRFATGDYTVRVRNHLRGTPDW